jgi:hypothetical protein
MFPDPRIPGFLLVWDPIQETVLPAALYFYAGNIDPDECRLYNDDEARICALDHGHYGPWGDLPDDVIWSNP